MPANPEFWTIVFAVLTANIITVAFVGAVISARGKTEDQVSGLTLTWFIIPLFAAAVGIWLYGVEGDETRLDEPPSSARQAPDGVDPRDWEYMTPEERALFEHSPDPAGSLTPEEAEELRRLEQELGLQ